VSRSAFSVPDDDGYGLLLLHPSPPMGERDDAEDAC
jgi:hypothetical protein